MKVRILPPAVEDSAAGFYFYEQENPGTGAYFLEHLEREIDELSFQAGIHPIRFSFYHVKYSRRFPFAIFYYVSENTVLVDAVLDCRQDPEKVRGRLESTE